MGSLVVAVEYLSLDGVMADPGWSGPFFNDEVAQFQLENLFGSDALLLGRTTYDGFRAAWPAMNDDEAGFGVRMNTMPKYVASRTRTEGEWNATMLTGDAVAEVTKLKAEFDGTLLINGSAELFQALHAAGLIDEYRFMLYPVVVGEGKRLFTDGGAATLNLVKSQLTDSGVAILTYQPSAA